jgi:glycogen debranching enzyme
MFRPIQVDLLIANPGAFCYFIEYDELTPGLPRIVGRKGYFNVDPIISLPARTPFFPPGETPPTGLLIDESSGAVLPKRAQLSLDGLIILSVLAKWMGKTNQWEKHFNEASRRGYNMLHWAPLQQRGASGSPYSIFEQLKYDKAILQKPDAADGGVKEIEEAITLAREKYGLGAVTDVVLNHTAFDSEWLLEHPEAGESTNSQAVNRADAVRLLTRQHTTPRPCR